MRSYSIKTGDTLSGYMLLAYAAYEVNLRTRYRAYIELMPETVSVILADGEKEGPLTLIDRKLALCDKPGCREVALDMCRMAGLKAECRESWMSGFSSAEVYVFDVEGGEA